MLGFQGSQVSSLQIATRFPALLTALFRALDEDGDGRITVEATGVRLQTCCHRQFLSPIFEHCRPLLFLRSSKQRWSPMSLQGDEHRFPMLSTTRSLLGHPHARMPGFLQEPHRAIPSQSELRGCVCSGCSGIPTGQRASMISRHGDFMQSQARAADIGRMQSSVELLQLPTGVGCVAPIMCRMCALALKCSANSTLWIGRICSVHTGQLSRTIASSRQNRSVRFGRFCHTYSKTSRPFNDNFY